MIVKVTVVAAAVLGSRLPTSRGRGKAIYR